MPIRDYASVANKVFHAYADSSRPDDTGNGLTWATAKKTIESVLAVLPDTVNDHCVIHLKGTFDPASYCLINVNIGGYNKRLVIDGGDEIIVVDGPYTSTSGTTTSLTDTGRSWTPNALQGMTLEITSGTFSGHRRTIQTNTADTLNVGYEFTSAVGAVDYRIIKPATLVTSSSFKWLYYTGKSSFDVYFQRLRIGGNANFGAGGAAKYNIVRAFDVIHEGTGYLTCNGGKVVISNGPPIDPTNPATTLSANLKTGFSHIGTSLYSVVLLHGALSIYPSCVLLQPVQTVENYNQIAIYSGAYLKQLIAKNSIITFNVNGTRPQPIILGSAGSGIYAENSSVTMASPVTVEGCAEHGIELKNSTLEITSGVLSGSGNTGAGVYAHSGSKVSYPDGSAPTITGTVGDIAITDPASEDLTWAELDAAGKAVIVAEDVILKKV